MSRRVLDDLRPDDTDLAYRDELTDLYNRRFLTPLFEEEWGLITSRCDDLSIIMIDLNLFKEVNDRYGHLSGDDVLRVTAMLLRNHFRRGDLIFRYGGDEFLVLLPGAGKGEASQLAERARLAMSEHEFLSHDRREKIDVPLTFCIGVASYPSDGTTPDELIARADALMYEEKQEARRRTVSVWWLIPRIAVAVLLALLPAILLLRWDDVVGLRTAPSTQEEPVDPPVEMQTLGAERMQLLRQIENLERQLDQLRSAAPPADESPVPEPPAIDPRETADIEALQRQIDSLTEQLRADRISSATRAEPIASPPPPPTREVGPPPVSRPVRPEPETSLSTTRAAEPDQVDPPRLLQPIQPRYPRIAHRLGKEAVLDLIVRIDERGRVVDARIVGPRHGFGFADAAIEAALRSTWSPGRRNGIPTEMETGLRVSFQIPR